MRKKGTTESYSALIGVIIAFLMLTAIGCAVYNIYKPKGANYFNKLSDQLRNLEKEGDGEGELSLFLEKDQFIVGFNKDQEAFDYSKDCPSNFVEGWIDWGCYGVHFLKPKDAVTTLALIPQWVATNLEKRPMKILKPKKCAADKTCLCLCKMDTLKWMPYGISEKTCTEQTAVCSSFDVIEFTGGEECCEGVFIPGTQGIGEQERGLRVVQYKKVGNRVSLSDLLFQSGLEKATEGERQKVAQLQEYLKTKKNIFFIPVNWDKDIREFERAVTSHYDYTEKKIKALEKKIGQTVLNSLSDGFNVVDLKGYKQCTGLDLGVEKEQQAIQELKSCLIKADSKVTEKALENSKIVGITDDEEVCGFSDTVNVVIANYKEPAITAHEWGHLMLFCDEYEYKAWKEQNDFLKEGNLNCMNPYPVCCKDHPYWKNNPEAYKEYLEKEKIGLNCHPHYQDLSDKAKKNFKTKEKYEEYLDSFPLCQGHVCKSESTQYKYCRGVMGPGTACEKKDMIYDNSLDYSYLDFDRIEDFETEILSEKQPAPTIPEPETLEEPAKNEAEVVLSYSCGEENIMLAEEVKSELEDNKELIPIIIGAKTEENACLLPDIFSEKIEQDYEHASYFVQVESDNTISDTNTVVVNSIESSPQSLELAKNIVTELKTENLNIVEGVSKDPLLNILSDSKRVIEIKTSKDNTRPASLIIKALIKDSTAKVCPLPVTYDEWIKKYAEENKISPSLLKALIKQESVFEPLAISISGSTGLLQFSYSTAQYYFGKDNVVPCCKVEKDETIYNSCNYEAKDRNSKWDSTDTYYCNLQTDKRFDPELSVKYGAQHLGELYNRYSKKRVYSGETIKFALAAYNQGEGCINYAISEFAKTGSELYTWDEVSDYIPNTKPCHSTARANVKNYVSKILAYEKEYLDCFA